MRVRSWLLLLLFVTMASNIGVIFNVMFFDAQECRLFAEKYGLYALENMESCKGLTAGGYLSVSELDNSAYLVLLVLPLLINAVMIALTSKKSPITLASFRYYCGVLALLACYVMIIGFLGLGGLFTNSYYLGSRCPDNMMGTDDCKFVIKNYNLGNQEIAIYLVLSASAMTASVWALKIIRDGASAIDHYKKHNTV